MMEGVITREQMQRGTVIVNGVEHVGRMFDSDPTIDRASVELCVELFTDDVMVAVANEVVSSYEMTLYRRHPSGIDRWYPHSVPVTGRQGDTQPTSRRHPPQATLPPSQASDRSQASEAQQPAAQRTEERSPTCSQPPKPRLELVRPSPHQNPRREPKNNLNAPPITQAVPVTRDRSTSTHPPITQAVPTISPITQAVPTLADHDAGAAATMPPPTAQIPVTAPRPRPKSMQRRSPTRWLRPSSAPSPAWARTASTSAARATRLD